MTKFIIGSSNGKIVSWNFETKEEFEKLLQTDSNFRNVVMESLKKITKLPNKQSAAEAAS